MFYLVSAYDKTKVSTLNKYTYCWNAPMDYVDKNGKFPWIVIPFVILATGGLMGCSLEEDNAPTESEDTTPADKMFIYKDIF